MIIDDTDVLGIPVDPEKQSPYERSRVEWLQRSQKRLDEFLEWIESADIEELEHWGGSLTVRTVLKTLKPHHRTSIKKEWRARMEALSKRKAERGER